MCLFGVLQCTNYIASFKVYSLTPMLSLEDVHVPHVLYGKQQKLCGGLRTRLALGLDNFFSTHYSIL